MPETPDPRETDRHASTNAPARHAALVKSRARVLGFAPVGITDAAPFPKDAERALAWISDGRNAGMAWITEERTRRAADPATLLHGARSLVVVGIPYGGADPEPTDDVPRGRVARYARGRDYHDVARSRLDALAQYIREVGEPDTHTRPFVDSSPLLERAAAVRAGLGFVGKNTNLIAPGAGSWLLLGAVLTTLALAPDPPVERDCGRCRLCLDACPTDAFVAPHVLDANRCISYLTIEHRGPIPVELRPALGDHVFGCDACQDVCPWNRADRGTPWPELTGPAEAARPVLADLLSSSAEAFRARYRGTPVSRTKRRGLLRNAAVALGNVGSADDLPALAGALSDDEPLVRGHAAWAIGQMGEPAGRALLEAALMAESDESVREEIAAALGRLAGAVP